MPLTHAIRIHSGIQYIEMGVDENGDFSVHTDVLAEPLDPPFSVHSMVGAYEVDVQWEDGAKAPVIVVDDLGTGGTGLGG